MAENPDYALYAYLTFDDIRQLQNYEDHTSDSVSYNLNNSEQIGFAKDWDQDHSKLGVSLRENHEDYTFVAIRAPLGSVIEVPDPKGLCQYFSDLGYSEEEIRKYQLNVYAPEVRHERKLRS